ncbi:MAG TPA: class I SAM-dependent methyltransferase, partial [Burkholderiales bacterium]|nr:class I SAM-dependent methyltransferase [Burkholderiales bacterium]
QPVSAADEGLARLDQANALLAQGRQLEAVQLLFEAVAARPRDPRMRFSLAGALEGFPLESAGAAVREILLDLCRDENIATQCLADAVIGLAKSNPMFPRLLEACIAGTDVLAARASEVAALTRDPLLLAVLSGAVANDAELERVLAHIRRCMLLRADIETVAFDFACALARQCFNTEYAMFAADEETQALQRLRQQEFSRDEKRLVLAALYGPLNRLPHWERMLQWIPESLSDAFRPIWQAQVVQYHQEREIAARIESLTPITAAVSQAVRGLYEENPYPRWLTLLRPQARALAEVVPAVAARARAGGRGSILIAGGGTGQHPIHTALTFPDSDVLTLDLSRASLAYAARMAERFGVKNLAFAQADILELASWEKRFDLIESLGVLHHMKDPLAGWRVLTGLLRDGGVMRIGLYSTIARRPLQAAREFARQSGFHATPEGIRQCRRAILDLPAQHPARAVLASDDFYSLSGCRDLIMHIQERSFTLPQIGNCLRKLGLRLLGLHCPPEVTAAFRADHPDPTALTDLSLWDRFEQRHPDVFRGMYQFSCSRRS